MKREKQARASALSPWDWGSYAVAVLLLLAGQAAVFNAQISLGIELSIWGLAVAAGRLVLPRLPWAMLSELLLALAKKSKAPRQPLAKALKAPKAAKAVKVMPAPRLGSKAAQQLGAWDHFFKGHFPKDRLELARAWILLPAGFFVVLMQISLLHESITRCVIFLGLALMLVAVFLQDLSKPFVLPQLSRNLGTAFRLLLAMPFEVWGFWLLWNYQHVWFGYFLTILGTSWMLRVLWLRPLCLEDDAAGEAALSLDYAVEGAWFSSSRLGQKTAMLAGAGICGFMAEEVLSSAYAPLQVGFGFMGIFLFIGSFPWFPYGVAELPGLSKPIRAAIVLGLVLLAFFLASTGQNAMESGFKARALWLFFFGGGTLVLALSRFKSLDFFQVKDKPWARYGEMAGLLLLLVTAFCFRIWHIGIFPYGAEGDEAGGGMWAMDALRGSVEHPLINQNYPLHFFSVTAVFFKLAGVTVESMRWHSVLFGTLSIAALYFFARLFVGRWSAWLATALMSFSYWHLHFSRFGHYNIEQVFCQMVAYYFVFKAMKTGRYIQFVLAGVAFALAMFPHMAGRLLPFQGFLFLGYLFVARRDLLAKNFSGFAAFVLGAWLISSPIVTYWLRATTVSMGRIQSVSIFDKNNTNAPVDVLAGFVQNCKVSMLMFNDMSDSRSRDNPLAPDKILEHWTAILFVLAFFYVLYHWRDPVHFFLLGAFFVNLSASIFSVEAPQTLRTAGNIPIVFAFIALAFGHFHSSLMDFGRKWGTVVFVALLLPAVAFFSYRSARRLFVDASQLAYDVEPTYIAEVAGQLGHPGDQAAFWATGFASSHPPVILFTGKTPIRNFYYMNEYLPVADQSERNHLLFLGDDYVQALPYLQSLYPKATPVTIPDKFGGADIAVYLSVPKEQLQAIQGLQVEAALPDGKKVSLPNQPLDYPLAALPGGARSLHYSGSLKMEQYGVDSFSASGKGDCSVHINGKLVFQRVGGRASKIAGTTLPIGLNSFSADFKPVSAADRFDVLISAVPPESRMAFSLRSSYQTVLPKTRLFMLHPQGFHASYYATADLSGPVVLEAVEPVVLAHWLDSPISGNWGVHWRAKLHISKAGEYAFRVNGPNTELRVDSQLGWRSGAPIKAQLNPPAAKATLHLEPGTHMLDAKFTSSGPPGMDIRWIVPGEREQLIPASVLEPVYP